MAIGPIDYYGMQPHEDLTSEFLRAAQLGAGLRQMFDQRDAQQLAQQRAAQYQADVGSFMQNPTPQGAAALQLKYPDQYEPISKAWAGLNADQQKNELQDTYALASTLHANRPDLALQQIDDRIQALKNSGMPTADLEALRTQVQDDPKAAYGQVLHIVSGLPGGDKILSNLSSVGKEARDQAESDVTIAGKQSDNELKNLSIVGQAAGALAKPGVKPEQAITMFKSLEARGVIPKGGAQGYIDNMPARPEDLPDYLASVRDAGINPDKQKAYTTPDANAQLSARTQVQTTGMNNRTQLAVQDRIAARQESKGDNVDQTQVENVAQMIASGRMAPLGAMAMRTPYGQAVMSRVAEINPAYRAQDFGTTSKAEKDFATGKQGNAVRSFNVGLAHLDTLGQLADALDNKDTQAINRIGNYFATQTGKEAPVKFEAAKKVVTDEIVKAIVGAGGTGHDREEAAKTVSAASSPAQLRGVIDTYKELMVGQLGGLEQQYRTTTGRDDFHKYLSPQAVALYGKHGGAPATAAPAAADHPADISALLKKYGGK